MRSLSQEWNDISAEERQRYVPDEGHANERPPEVQAQPVQMPSSATLFGLGSATKPLEEMHLKEVAERARLANSRII